MNQDGSAVNGEAQDAFSSQFVLVSPEGAGQVPVSEGFEDSGVARPRASAMGVGKQQ